MSNKDIPDLDLARVVEIASDPNCRWFDATLQDGTQCRVSVEKKDDLHCHRHGIGDCEGCRRVLFVLTGEKKKQLYLTLLGYEIRGSDAPPVEIRPARPLSLRIVS